MTYANIFFQNRYEGNTFLIGICKICIYKVSAKKYSLQICYFL